MDAESAYRRALSLQEMALPPNDPRIADSVARLGELLVKRRRLFEAEQLYQRAAAILEDAQAYDLELSEVYLALARLHLQRGAREEAEAFAVLSDLSRGDDPPDTKAAVLTSDRLSDQAIAQINRFHLREAEILTRRSLLIRERLLGEDHPRVASSLNNLGIVYVGMGRYEAAEHHFLRALKIGEAAFGLTDHLVVAGILSSLGNLYGFEGRGRDADALLRRAAENWRRGEGFLSPQFALGLSNLATNSAAEGRLDEAERYLREIIAILDRKLPNAQLGSALASLAQVVNMRGRPAEADSLFERSLTILERFLGRDHPDVGGVLSSLSAFLSAQNRNAEAEIHARRADAVLRAANGPTDVGVATNLATLAAIQHRQGHLTEALTSARRATTILAGRISNPSPPSSGKIGEQLTLRFQYLTHIAIAAAVAGQNPGQQVELMRESFEIAQRAGGSAAARAMARASARVAAGPGPLAFGLRERQDAVERWQIADRALVVQLGLPAARRDPSEVEALRGELLQLGKRVRELDAQLAQVAPELAQISDPPPVALSAAQALLGREEALLVYVTAASESFLWLLRHDRAAFFTLPIDALALATEVTALRTRLDPTTNPLMKPFDASRSYDLYKNILAAAAPLLVGVRHILLVPDGALESLPIGVLVTEPPRADPEKPSNHREISWLARKHAITVLPSVGSLRALRQFPSRARAALPFAGVGDPVLQGNPAGARGVKLASLFRGTVADVAAVRNLTPLPETADELRTVAKSLGAGESDLWLGDRASEPLLRQAGLDRYRVLSFATHGLMSGDLKGLAEPALVLTPPAEGTPENDGLLTASEVAQLKLNADWVVLSACNTAAADGTPDAGGLSGLAKAFFYAGARSLLVSHWSVPSQATVKLMTGAFDALAKDPSIGRAEALRQSQLAMMDDKNSPPEFAHPLAWAPFVLAGEGGAGR